MSFTRPVQNVATPVKGDVKNKEENDDDAEKRPHTPPQPFHAEAHAPANTFMLLGKMKAVVHEVLTSLRNASYVDDMDDYIALAEDCLRSLKTIKLERRIEARRQNLSQRTITTVPASTREANSETDCSARVSPPRTYLAALMRHKKVSPKRTSPFRAPVTRETVEAARHTSALRSEERQRQAEERRLDHIQVIRQRSEAADARSLRARARRQEAEQRQREEAQDRMESTLRRAEAVRQQTVERAHRAHSRVEEVRLVSELRQQTKALLLDRKMTEIEHNREQRKEERQRVAQERQDAMLAVAERRRTLSLERLERQQQRELQRQENLRRVEDQRRQEQEIKQQRAEEWEKKVHQHHVDAHAESEARSRRTEEKLQVSAQLREEQRERLRKKLEQQEQKSKEAKLRRDRESEGGKSAHSDPARLLLTLPDEEQVGQRLGRLTATMARQAKTFVDVYQKESGITPKELNRSKMRALFARLGTFLAIPAWTQCRQSLHDLLTAELTSTDHEYVRFFNWFETLSKVIVEACHARQTDVMRCTAALLTALLTHETEGRSHVLYFVRSGALVSLFQAVREEVRTVRVNGATDVLCILLTFLAVCIARVCADATTNAKLHALRDQVMSDFEVAGIDRVCLAIVVLPLRANHVTLVYSALSVLFPWLSTVSRRKGEFRFSYFNEFVMGLFSLLQHLLIPDDAVDSLVNGVDGVRALCEPMNAASMTLLFAAFRLLNILARWQLAQLQNVLHDSAPNLLTDNQAISPDTATGETHKDSACPMHITRMELYHVLSRFFTYVQRHTDQLEPIPQYPEIAVDYSFSSPSFDDATRFGVTICGLPVFPDMASANGAEPSPSSKPYPLRATLHECLLFAGYLCLDDPALQEVFAWGTEHTLLSQLLSALPGHYFLNGRHILFPTLLIILADDDRNTSIAKAEMALDQLLAFLDGEYNALSKRARSYAQEHHEALMANKLADNPTRAYVLSMRGKNWAQLMDDDDDYTVSQDHATSDIAKTSSAQEKDKLCKSLRGYAMSWQGYFRVERRLPIAYWPSIIQQLRDVLNLPHA